MSEDGRPRVHFIGIGGSGMAPLARLAALADDPGYQISGTDRGLSAEALEELRSRGWEVFAEHDPAHVAGRDIVVYSTAIAPDHPERARAAELAARGEIVLEHRMDFLLRLVERCPLQLAVAGTHGKTSTASLLGWTLLELGVDPDIIVGGRPAYLPGGVRRGAGQVAVYETDESDASFLKTRAPYRLCLNIDRDHLEHYGDMENLVRAFAEFAAVGETIVLNHDDPILRETVFAAAADRTRCWYRTGEEDVKEEVTTDASLYDGAFQPGGDHLNLVVPEAAGTIELPLPGRHFASNALGAFALVDRLRLSGKVPALADVTRADIIAVMNRFPGVERRLELLGRPNDVAVYDDYGHHPTEIRAVLAALRGRLHPGARLIAVFQPHRYSRTAALYSEFAAALAVDADEVFLLPIYSAGETSREGVNAAMIREAREAGGIDFVVLDEHDWPRIFRGRAAHDVIVCLGAGDISPSIREYLKSFP